MHKLTLSWWGVYKQNTNSIQADEGYKNKTTIQYKLMGVYNQNTNSIQADEGYINETPIQYKLMRGIKTKQQFNKIGRASCRERV